MTGDTVAPLRRQHNLHKVAKYGSVLKELEKIKMQAEHEDSDDAHSFVSQDSEDFDFKNLSLIPKQIDYAINYYENP